MNTADRFRFEDEELDFPFYRKNPYVPKWGWIVLFIAMIIGLVFFNQSTSSFYGALMHSADCSCIVFFEMGL